MHDISSPDHTGLFNVASSQNGYFTAAQARECGFSYALLRHHRTVGRFERVRWGLYRLRDYPRSIRDEVVAAWLAAGNKVAVVSHESALEILQLADVVPDRIHLTVPRSQRGRRSIPGVKIHTTMVPPDDDEVVIRDGMRVTNAVRSIVDAITAGMSPEQAIVAVRQAIERGMATRAQFHQRGAREGGLVERLLEQALFEAAVE